MNPPAEDHGLLATSAAPGLLTEWRVLWRTAPAWRSLLIGGLGLASVAICTPFLQSEPAPAPAAVAVSEAHDANATSQAVPNQQTCGIRPGPLVADGAGKVLRFMTPAQASKALEANQAAYRAEIDPAYLQNARAIVVDKVGTQTRARIALVPTAMKVVIGDIVEFRGAYGNPDLPCNYVPNVITRVVSGSSATALQSR